MTSVPNPFWASNVRGTDYTFISGCVRLTGFVALNPVKKTISTKTLRKHSFKNVF